MKIIFKNLNMRFYLLLILVSIEMLMSFSFIGYIHIEPISMTIAYIPVMLAGAMIGLPEAVILGAVFGISSMWKAGAHYVTDIDQLFSPSMSGFPLESILFSVGSRILFGLLIGILYMAAKRMSFKGLWIFIVSFLGRFIHSFLVYSFMGVLFPDSGYSALHALDGIYNVNNYITDIFTSVIVVLLWRWEQSDAWKKFCCKVEKAQRLRLGGSYHTLVLVVSILVTVFLSLAVGVYFINRMLRVLSQNGINLTNAVYSDLIHLQIQFIVGILSLMCLVAVFLMLNRKYSMYMDHEAGMDVVTDVMNRRAFFQACRKVLDKQDPEGDFYGYFIMVDIDYFKEINDSCGHPEGDRILMFVAHHLKEIFGENGFIGRIGGDEFAVFIYMPVSEEKLESDMKLFMEKIRSISVNNHSLSCSAGVVPAASDKSVEDLYRETDRLLYTVKKRGRDNYIIGSSGIIAF